MTPKNCVWRCKERESYFKEVLGGTSDMKNLLALKTGQKFSISFNKNTETINVLNESTKVKFEILLENGRVVISKETPLDDDYLYIVDGVGYRVKELFFDDMKKSLKIALSIASAIETLQYRQKKRYCVKAVPFSLFTIMSSFFREQLFTLFKFLIQVFINDIGLVIIAII